MIFLLLLSPLVAFTTNFGYVGGIIDSETQSYNAIDKCGQFQNNTDFVNCSSGYYMVISWCWESPCDSISIEFVII